MGNPNFKVISNSPQALWMESWKMTLEYLELITVLKTYLLPVWPDNLLMNTLHEKIF